MGRGLKVGHESENLPAVVIRFCVLAIGTKDAGLDVCSTASSNGISARAVSGLLKPSFPSWERRFFYWNIAAVDPRVKGLKVRRKEGERNVESPKLTVSCYVSP